MQETRADESARLHGGAVIALIGPDASGKTTIARELSAVLERRGRRVRIVHLGAPDESVLTAAGRAVLKGLRKALRMVRGHRTLEGVETLYPRLQAGLDVMTAIDRRTLALQCGTWCRAGSMVITDRYPGRAPGAASGPGLGDSTSGTAAMLRRIEQRIYASIPNPTVVVRLEVPEEETVRRNAGRAEPKGEAVIRVSHSAARLLRFEGVPEIVIVNTGRLDETVEYLLDRLAPHLSEQRT